jgi:hypothetical protein
MKTMMDLLTSLRRMDAAAEAAARNCQLSPGEKEAARRHVDLVREVLPAHILANYDDLKTTASDLLESPELLSMAVLLTTYRGLSPAKRKTLLNHFKKTTKASTSRNSRRQSGQVLAGTVRPPAIQAQIATAD